MKFIMKVENLTLIEKIKKLEKRLHEIERRLVLIEKKLNEFDTHFRQKNKDIEEFNDHLVIPHVQVLG